MTPPKFSYVEAYPAYGHWHIRAVGPEGLKFSGGAPPPLCYLDDPGEKWHNGWDLNLDVEVTRFSPKLNALSTKKQLEDACPKCVELYLAQVKKEQQ